MAEPTSPKLLENSLIENLPCMLHFLKQGQCLCLSVYSLSAALHQSLEVQSESHCSHLHISSDKYAFCDWIVEHFLGNFCVMPPLNSLPKWFISLCITISYIFCPVSLWLAAYLLWLNLVPFLSNPQFSPRPHSSRKFIAILNRIMSTLVVLLLSCYYFYSCPLILLWIAFMRSILKNLF